MNELINLFNDKSLVVILFMYFDDYKLYIDEINVEIMKYLLSSIYRLKKKGYEYDSNDLESIEYMDDTIFAEQFFVNINAADLILSETNNGTKLINYLCLNPNDKIVDILLKYIKENNEKICWSNLCKNRNSRICKIILQMLDAEDPRVMDNMSKLCSNSHEDIVKYVLRKIELKELDKYDSWVMQCLLENTNTKILNLFPEIDEIIKTQSVKYTDDYGDDESAKYYSLCGNSNDKIVDKLLNIANILEHSIIGSNENIKIFDKILIKLKAKENDQKLLQLHMSLVSYFDKFL